MSLELKMRATSFKSLGSPRPWKPTADKDSLALRAKLLRKTREFFHDRGVLEVETPALGETGVTDVHIAGLTAATCDGERYYLQTSPEYYMKRLLSAGSGDIYQICKVFRDSEQGGLHHPEFTMLEWYRVGFDHHQLMAEVADLLQVLLGLENPASKLSYREAFHRYAGCDPVTVTRRDLDEIAAKIGARTLDLSFDAALDLIGSHLVYPRLGDEGVTFIYDFPASQAALARIRQGEPPLAERFEAFYKGVELANGFHELTDAGEQRARFLADNQRRLASGLPAVPLDEQLLAALNAGLPECSGVAVGFDRLVMLAAGKKSIKDILSFSLF
ncbi:MAG: EF-P lysine aminoacylase GenX [Gammaproteobacteria bacterium]|nr:EF-P lysine aminoacylase GenX [Gammaproteobacteria bacterium]